MIKEKPKPGSRRMSSHTLRIARLALICLMVLAGCPGLDAGTQSPDGARSELAGTGALAGSVTLWPASPVERPGVPTPRRPAPGVKIMIYGPERQEITSVTTKDQGEFRVHLPPGTYLVEMAPDKRGFTKNLPATVTITPGQETRLNILLDTGLR